MSVWLIGSTWSEDGDLKAVFKTHKIAFAGQPEPQGRILNDVEKDDYIAIKQGFQIQAVGLVEGKKKLSEINPNLSQEYGDLNTLVLKQLFWREDSNNSDEWPSMPYRRQFVQIQNAKYEREIIGIFTVLNSHFQENKMKNDIQALLEANHQIILTGAPGTGKTHLARQVAAKMIGLDDDKVDDLKKHPDRFNFVQFHPAYDYTDFVEGLKPVKSSNPANNSIGFERRDGVFMDFCKKAAPLGDQPCVFVIDEINRADLSRVFGELFFALESDYRGSAVVTQYASLREANEEKQFSVPKNVFIIGTMNDIDRSVESIDFALRRRFAWYEVKADDRCFNVVMTGTDLEDTIKEEAKKRYSRLNDEIGQTKGLGSSYHIGPAYYRKLARYCQGDKGDETIWKIFWDRHLELLLREYLRGRTDEQEKLKKFRNAYDLQSVSQANSPQA